MTRKELKNNIYSVYLQYIKEDENIEKYRAKLWDFIYKWTGKYSFLVSSLFLKKYPDLLDDMGLEILKIVDNLKNISFENIDDFYKLLNVSLKNAAMKIYSEYEYGSIKMVPGKFKKVQYLISVKQREKGRSLTDDELRAIINMYMDEAEYFEIEIILNSHSLDYKYKDKDESKILSIIDTIELSSIFQSIEDSNALNPEKHFEAVEYTKIFLEAVEDALEYTKTGKKRRKSVKECYRSLFTVFCIEKALGYLDKLEKVLDKQIYEKYIKNPDIKPTQFEAYLKHHPDRQNKSSIESSASDGLKEFIEDVRNRLLANY